METPMTTRHFCDCCDTELVSTNNPDRPMTLEYNMATRTTRRPLAMVNIKVVIDTPDHICTDCVWRTLDRADPRPKVREEVA
jgi:hypothetical protein